MDAAGNLDWCQITSAQTQQQISMINIQLAQLQNNNTTVSQLLLGHPLCLFFIHFVPRQICR